MCIALFYYRALINKIWEKTEEEAKIIQVDMHLFKNFKIFYEEAYISSNSATVSMPSN